MIVPAYNTARYIGETLDSIFAQTFHNYDVIVVNDRSPDTAQLEEILGKYSDRIRYFKQPNLGLSATRNLAIQHSCSELLAFLDSDDVWLPVYLQTQVEFLDQNPRAVAAIADYIRFGELMGNPDVRRLLSPARISC